MGRHFFKTHKSQLKVMRATHHHRHLKSLRHGRINEQYGKMGVKVPNWKAKKRIPFRWFYQINKRHPRLGRGYNMKRNVHERHLRPTGNFMPATLKLARNSALAQFMGYRFPQKFTRDHTLCIYRYYLPPPAFNRTNRRDFGGEHFPNEWQFMNHNAIYQAKFNTMMYHLFIKGRNHNLKNGDLNMKLINEGVLLNNYPHPLLPLVRAYVKQKTLQHSSALEYDMLVHFAITCMFVPDTAFICRYITPWCFYDRRTMPAIGALLTVVTEMKASNLIEFYNTAFVRKMSFRWTKLSGYSRVIVTWRDRDTSIYKARRKVEEYSKMEVPPYEHIHS